MQTRRGTCCARMEVAPFLIVYGFARPRLRCHGPLVLGFDARQQDLREVVGLEFGRGVCVAVFANQVVLDLAIRIAVAGRKLDKLNGRVHGVG